VACALHCTTPTSSTVKTNTANQAGGIASVNGTLTITSSTVTLNAATVNPGGIHYVAGSATLNTSTVTANTPTNCVSSPSPVPGCIGRFLIGERSSGSRSGRRAG
jgi:hypothetical protein